MPSVKQPDGSLTPDPYEVGKQVCTARIEAGLSQTELAKQVDALGVPLSQSKVTAIESGKQLPNQEVVNVLNKVLPDLKLKGAFPHARVRPRGATAPPVKTSVTTPEAASMTRVPGTKVSEFRRVTVYMAPEAKATLDATAAVLNESAYKILARSLAEYITRLPEADRAMIQKLVAHTLKG